MCLMNIEKMNNEYRNRNKLILNFKLILNCLNI